MTSDIITALGGSFDHFHAGHKHFLRTAAKLGNELLIGVTAQHLVQHKKLSHLIQSYSERVAAVENFCAAENIPCTVVELTDIFGPTLTNEKIGALAFTKDTKKGAEKIVESRKLRGLPALRLLEVSLVTDTTGKYISSERIRSGEVSRSGRVYASLFFTSRALSETARQQLHAPLGEIVQTMQPNIPCFCVGDTTTQTALEQNIPYTLALVDYLQQRVPSVRRCIDRSSFVTTCVNPPHTISKELVLSITKALQFGEKNILVLGEEDLATVVLVLLLPLASSVYYGQPNVGLVECICTEELKDRLYELLCL